MERAGGYEVKAQGDGFMLAFPSARSAILCSMEIMRALEVHGRSRPNDALRVRIGMHTGEAIEEDGDLFGKPVVLAARIANQASGGEILVSSLVREIVESRGDLTFGASREVELKGLVGRHLLHPAAVVATGDRAPDRARGCAMAMTDDRHRRALRRCRRPSIPAGTSTTQVRFTVLRGGVGVVRDGELVAIGGPQQQRLLAALLAAQGAAVSADRLADTIWPEGAAPEGARRSVMTYVSRLRAAVGGDYVVTGANGYQLVLGDASYDAADFEDRSGGGEGVVWRRGDRCIR